MSRMSELALGRELQKPIDALPQEPHAMVPAPVVNTDAGSLMAVISRAAADPATDVDKLERLLGMYERITARSAEQAFNEAMQAAQKEMQPIRRDAKNDTTNSRYARLETVIAAIDPIITRFGFSMSFGTDVSPVEGCHRITCRLAHNGGHSREYHADVPADLTGMKGTPNKTRTHAFGSTISYGRRYLTLLIFNLATADDDDGQMAGSRTVTAEQRDALLDLAEQAGIDKKHFCEWLGTESFASLPARDYRKAENAIRDFMKRNPRPAQ